MPVGLNWLQSGVRYSDFQAFSFLVAGTVFAAFWSLLMLVLDLILLASGRVLHSIALLTIIVICDFVRRHFANSSTVYFLF